MMSLRRYIQLLTGCTILTIFILVYVFFSLLTLTTDVIGQQDEVIGVTSPEEQTMAEGLWPEHQATNL